MAKTGLSYQQVVHMTTKQISAVATAEKAAAQEMTDSYTWAQDVQNAQEAWQTASTACQTGSPSCQQDTNAYNRANTDAWRAEQDLIDAEQQTDKALGRLAGAFAPPGAGGWLSTAAHIAETTTKVVAGIGAAVYCASSEVGWASCAAATAGAGGLTVGIDLANSCPVGVTVADTMLTLVGVKFAAVSSLGAEAGESFEAETLNYAIMQYGFKGSAGIIGALAPDATITAC